MSAPYDWHEHVPTLKDIVIGCTVYAAVLAILVIACSLHGSTDIAPGPAVAVAVPAHVRTAPDEDAADSAADIAGSRLSDGRY